MQRTTSWVFPLLFAGMFVVTDAAEAAGPKVEPKAPLKAFPFDLKQVRLLEGPFRAAMERDRKYLHELDSERQ